MNFRHLLIMSLMLFAGINVAVSQTTFTQTESGDFQKGTGQDVAVVDGSVAVRSKMASMIDWEATTNLPAVRRNHQMVTWRDYVFCIGGSTNGTNSVNTVYSAQSTTNGLSSWTTLNAMPVYLRDMAAVATQTRLIVAGGRNNNGVSDKIYVATISSGTLIGTWTESTFTLPQPLWGARAISVLDYIYIIGGATTDSPDDASNKVYCLKLNAIGDIASVTEVANLPEARNGHDVTTYDSKIYVTGGYDASHTLKSTVYCATVNLNGSLGAWQTQTPLPVAIANHTSLCTHGIIGVMGGFDGELQTNRFYSANPDDAQLSWSMSSTMLFERNQDGDAFVINDKMYFAGGLNLQGVVTNYVRYATILTGSEKVKKASFISSPFDIGSEKTIQDMAYTLTYAQETASYEMLYRVADNDMLFGDWISAGTANPATLNLSKSHVQYMFRMTSTADDDMQINDFSITMPGFTQLSGNLNNMAVLTLDASPYWVTGDIAFTSGSHVIEAGVTMYFALNKSLTIGKASVNFNGTEELPITLTFQGDDEAKWKGVYFQDDSDNTVRSSMTYTTITNAGYGGDYNANLYLNKTSQPSMSNCVFANAEGHGLRLVESSPSIVSCSFSGNSECGIYLSNSAPNCVDCSMSGNAYGVYYGTTNFNASYNSVTVTGNDVGLYSCSPDRDFIFNPDEISISGNVADIAVSGGQIKADRTWNVVSSCYRILGDIQIYNSTTTQPKLTLQPGCVLKFAEGKHLDVAHYDGNTSNYYTDHGGKLYAVGTPTDSIVFTALNGQPGGWGGIRFNTGSDYNSASSMRYCVIEKAIENVRSIYTTQPTIQFSTIKDASDSGVALYHADITIEESTLCNSTRGLYLSSSSPLLVQVTFDNMSHSCVYHATVSNHVLYHSCIMRNSFAGVRFFGPDTDIPAHPEVAFSGNGTEVYVDGGNLYNDSRIWGKNNYLVGGNIGIYGSSDAPRLLTIGEGSVVKFAAGTRMYVGCRLNSDGSIYDQYYYGRLNAVGSAEEPVVFTSESGEPGGWNGLYFNRYCNTSRPSLLKHCIVENGTCNVQTDNSMPVIEDCQIRNATGNGMALYCYGTYDNPGRMSNTVVSGSGNHGVYSSEGWYRLFDCEINGNGSYGMYYSNVNYLDSLQNVSFSGNGTDGVGIATSNLESDRTWLSLVNGAYYVLGNIGISRYNSSGTTTSNLLTIDEGSVVKFAAGTGMYVGCGINSDGSLDTYRRYGKLNAVGSAEEPVVFTSESGEPGGWYGLNFRSSSHPSSLKHCIVENATTGVYMTQAGATTTIEDCIVRNATSYGMNLYQSSPTLKRCRFNGNATGIYIQDYNNNQSNPTIGNDYVNGCDFFNNGLHVKHTGKANITMAYNYMGAIDSTFIEDHLIYDKADDANSGKLTFLPVSWLPMTFSEGFDWSGNLLYDGNTDYPMTGNAIKVTDFHDALLYETTSGANGAFHIDDLQLNVANKVQIVTDLNINSNVNSTDALKVMNHFVHGTTLDERHLVVADVNKSKTVNGTDALLIQRRFVDLIDTFPLGDMSYTYDSVGHVDESSVYMKLNALCVGDVQVNNPNLRDGVNLSYDGELFATSGQLLELPVRVTEDMEIGAISLRMLFPTEYLSVEQVLVAGEEALVSGQDGQLNISWYSLNPLYLEAGETLLTIKATTKDLSMLNEPVAFTLNSGSEFADANAFPYGSVTIAMPVVTTTTLGVDETSEDSDVMLKAYPNPTDGRCVIDYELSNDCRVSMELYNVMGYRMLRMEDSYQTAGRHQVEFDATRLSAGVYYCRLTCSDKQSEPKVIKIMIK